MPEWQGEPLHEKLLIYAEQGLGDQIMFASCVPDVLKMADTCLIECMPPLVPLFARSFAGATVVSQPRDDADLVRTAQAAGRYAIKLRLAACPRVFADTAAIFPITPTICAPTRRGSHTGKTVSMLWARA